MDKRYRKKGLFIISPEVQGSSEGSIKNIINDHKIKFTVTKGVRGPNTGRGIPRAVVFNSDGKIVFTGHPGDSKFDKSIKKALRELKKNGGVPAVGAKENSKPSDKTLIPERSWTNSEGKKIKASVLALNGDKVQFKLPNGKKVSYPLNKLSEESQDTIKEAASKATKAAE